MDPEGRIVVVTGASGGIGGALVRALVERGARNVVAVDLDTAGAEALRDELGSASVLARALDVTDEAATRACVAEIEASIGPIDVFFANAGVSTGGGPDAASMAGLLSALGDAAYSATKHAAVGFAEWLAFTYGAQGVRVSCICPGAVDTAMLRAGAGGDAQKASTAIGGGDVLAPEQAAERILDALADDRFLILTHPEMREFMVVKAQDPERWIGGMSKLWARAQALLR